MTFDARKILPAVALVAAQFALVALPSSAMAQKAQFQRTKPHVNVGSGSTAQPKGSFQNATGGGTTQGAGEQPKPQGKPKPR